MTTDYGRELSVTTSLRTGRFATGAQLIGESVYRRLTTPRGMLRGGEEDANFGLDLTELIGSATTKSDAAALPGRIRSELLKDERLETVEATVVASTDGPATSFVITIVVTTTEGPFTLKLLASDVTVELLGIS